MSMTIRDPPFIHIPAPMSQSIPQQVKDNAEKEQRDTLLVKGTRRQRTFR